MRGSGDADPVTAACLRDVRLGDADEVAAIYGYHVLHGTASFDEVPPDAQYWRERIRFIRARSWPFIVVEDGAGVRGYAYATQFRDRPAYAHTCENSIYLRLDAMGQGLGTMLLAGLVERAAASGFRQMIAVIGGGEPASVALHRKLGFRQAGRMESVGFKFGLWLDTVYMQRALSQH